MSSGHFSINIVAQKILDVGFGGQACIMTQLLFLWFVLENGNLSTQSLAKLVTNLLVKPFTKWGLDFLGPIKLATN